MASNTFKIAPENQKRSFFRRFEKLVKIDLAFEHGLPVKYLPYIVFMTVVGIFYIGNSHYAERNIREIDRLKKEVEDLRADYTTLKADYMFGSKQSEVAKSVKKLGIVESLQPPEKIEVKKGEY